MNRFHRTRRFKAPLCTQSPRRRLGFEDLESRRLLAAYVVTTTNDAIDPDDGVVSLREAITQANASPGGDAIAFNLPGPGPHTISPNSFLPVLTGGSINIDATTQPGYNGAPVIEISGQNMPDRSAMLSLQSEGNTIRGLAVNRGHGVGVFVFPNANQSLIAQNHIGTDVTGTLDLGNEYQGIFIQSNDNRIVDNVISGNDSHGIWIDSGRGGGYENTVIGNRIGTDATGLLDVGNTYHGVILTAGTHHNYIGVDGADGSINGNIIAGNDASGIDIESSNDNVIQGNTIGLGGDGLTEMGHPAVGIYVVGSRNQIGGSGTGVGNTVSASGYSGIEVFGAGSSDNVIQGNRIGTDVTGTIARPNGTADTFNSIGGILLGVDTTRTIVGSDEDGVGDATEGNIIAGNLGDGIRIYSSSDNRISGNLLGVVQTGLAALPNTGNGIRLDDHYDNNQIGGSTTAARNVVSGNLGSGVFVQASADNWIAGNYIGTDITGTVPLGNEAPGAWIRAASASNIVGTNSDGIDDASEGNVLSANEIGVNGDGVVDSSDFLTLRRSLGRSVASTLDLDD